MKLLKVVAAALLLALVASTPALADQGCGGRGASDPCLDQYYARYCADDCYSDIESHPFRLVAYAVHPIGVALEWAIMRPLHWAVSRPSTAPIFGHTCDYIE